MYFLFCSPKTNLAARLLGNKVNITNLHGSLQQMFIPQENKTYWSIPRGPLTILWKDKLILIPNSKTNVFTWVSTLSQRDGGPCRREQKVHLKCWYLSIKLYVIIRQYGSILPTSNSTSALGPHSPMGSEVPLGGLAVRSEAAHCTTPVSGVWNLELHLYASFKRSCL